MSKPTTAIYALSGDPITYGHIDIIKRAAKVFDKLIVALGINPKKKYTFNLEQRKKMAQVVLKPIANVQVTSFKGLLVDFAYENNVSIIVKGVRSSADFNYERSLHLIGESQKLGIDTFVLFAKPELSHISSSAVKQIQVEHGLIHEYVPLYVKQCLEKVMSQQFIVGVTGSIGVGKSYVCQNLVEIGQKHDLPVHNIELDHLTHQIYDELTHPRYKKIRKTIFETFGQEVKKKNGKVNRKKLGEIVFHDRDKLQQLNKIMTKPLMVRIGRSLYRKKGLILLNAALIVETDMAYLSNNNVVLIKSNKDQQLQRLKKRNLSKDQMERRLENQYNFDQKKEKMQAIIQRDNYGKIWEFDNSSTDNFKKLNQLYQDITQYFNLKSETCV